MEFTIRKELLSDALTLIASVVPERSTKPILQNLKLTGNPDSSITLSATDLEIGITQTLEVTDLKDPLTVLLPASRLNALVKAAFTEVFHIDIQDNKLQVKTKQGHFTLMGQDSADYVTIPEFKPAGAIFMHGDDFADAVQKTVFATARGDTRYALSGIYMNASEQNIDFVASDTHRLSLVKKKIRNPDQTVFDGILLGKGMNILARLAQGMEILELTLTQNELLARTHNASLFIRRIDGMFPRYQDVIPPKRDSKFSVNRDDLQRGLQQIGLMSPEESKSVLFKVTDGNLCLSSQSDNGAGDLNIDAETTGEKVEIKFNYLFLLEALKNIVDPTVTIQYKDDDNPARLDSGDFLYVLMPMNR